MYTVQGIEEEAWRSELHRGEEVVWAGGSAPGVHVRPSDVPVMVVAVVVLGFFGVMAVSGSPAMLLVPHLWAFLYAGFGRLYYERHQRERTTYVVTDHRALILRTWPRRRTTSVELTGAVLTRHDHRDGTATIDLGASRRTWWNNRAPRPVAFEWIADPDTVFAALTRPRRDLAARA